MCVIIDACKASAFSTRAEECTSLRAAVESNRIRVAVGGKLSEELSVTPFARELTGMIRIGLAAVFDARSIEQHANAKADQMESNDHHVIGLAIVSGARLLYSADNALKRDFRSRTILPARSGVRGRIYRDERDRDLIYQTPACR